MLALIALASLAAAPMVKVDHGSPVIAVALSPDDKVMATAGRGAALVLWSADTGKRLREASLGKTDVLQLAFSADGAWLAGADLMGNVSVWSVGDGKTVGSFKVEDSVDRLAFSPDRKVLAVGVMLSPGVLISTADWKPGGSFDGSPVCWAADGKSLLVSRKTGFGWVDAAGKPQRAVEAPSHHPVVIAVDHQTALARSGTANDVQIWDVAQGKLTGTLPASSSGVVALALSRDGKRAVTGSEENVTRLWDVGSRKELGKWEGKFATLSPSGRYVATAAGNVVQLWPAAQAK